MFIASLGHEGFRYIIHYTCFRYIFSFSLASVYFLFYVFISRCVSVREKSLGKSNSLKQTCRTNWLSKADMTVVRWFRRLRIHLVQNRGVPSSPWDMKMERSLILILVDSRPTQQNHELCESSSWFANRKHSSAPLKVYD